jgi:hypothetical protein
MTTPRITRRPFLHSALAAGVGLMGFARRGLAGHAVKLPPTRVITTGPKHHWFGYYDKLEFDPSGRYVLGMEANFQHRTPRPDDVIAVGMVDLADNDRWIELGHTTAWCWQQGCMLQWIPGSPTRVLWNDRDGSDYVCRIVDVATRVMRTIGHPIYALSPDGRTAIAPDFRRLADLRPGYGYVGFPDPFAAQRMPEQTGLFKVDLETGRQELLFSIAEVAAVGKTLPSMKGAKHWFNHLLFNPDGSRFVFLHRWQAGRSRETRMFTAAPDGSDLRLVDGNGLTSHFIWRDPAHILAYSKQPSHGARFYLFEDGGAARVEVVGPNVMTRDGHCSYLPDNKWIINDTYPDRQRRQSPYLYHVATGAVVPLGHFVSPMEYTGEWRCDTHPRFSPDGRNIVIDSPDGEAGRQLHLIDVSEIVA